MVHDQLNVTSGSQSISANGNANLTPFFPGAGFHYGMFQFNVSAVPVGGAPTLDVWLQTSVDLGVTWRDIAHAAQWTVTASIFFCQIQGETTGAAAFLAVSDAVLAANTTLQGPWGDRLRIKWVFVAGGSAGPYTLAVTGVLK